MPDVLDFLVLLLPSTGFLVMVVLWKARGGVLRCLENELGRERERREQAEADRDEALRGEARASRHAWGWCNAYRHEVSQRLRRQGCPRVHEEAG